MVEVFRPRIVSIGIAVSGHDQSPVGGQGLIDGAHRSRASDERVTTLRGKTTTFFSGRSGCLSWNPSRGSTVLMPACFACGKPLRGMNRGCRASQAHGRSSPTHDSGVMIIPCRVPGGQGRQGGFSSSRSKKENGRSIDRPSRRLYGAAGSTGLLISSPEPVEPSAPALSRTRVSDWIPAWPDRGPWLECECSP